MFGRMVWKSLIGGRGRTALTLATIFVPAALVTATANFTLDAEQKMTTELRNQGPNVVLEVKRGIPSIDPAELARALGRFPSVLSRGPADRPDRVEISAGGRDPQIIAAAEAVTREFRTLQARTMPVIAAQEGALLGKLRSLFELMGLLVLGSSGLAMTMALTSSVGERIPEIGLLKALGSTRALILRLFAAQVGAILLAGVALGSLAGLALSCAMSRGVFGLPSGLRLGAVGLAAYACAAMAALASVVPVRRAFQVQAAVVLKGE